MANIIDKIKDYVDDDSDEEEIEYEEAADILDRMYDLLTSLDPDKMSDTQADKFVSIMNDLADENDEEQESDRKDEGVPPKRVKISPTLKEKKNE
ncbi:unnamed protein product, partial [marine sediment metagenome]